MKPRAKLHSIYPPADARWNPEEFGAWLRTVGRKLVDARLDVTLIPMVAGNESLFLGIETDDATAQEVRRVLYLH